MSQTDYDYCAEVAAGSRHAPLAAAASAAKRADRDRSLIARMSANIASGTVPLSGRTMDPAKLRERAKFCVALAKAILEEIDS